MPGRNATICWVRCAIALWLALQVPAASTAALSMGNSSDASSPSCCRHHGKCLCKAHVPDSAAPAFTSRACSSNCGRLVLGTAAAGFVPASARPVALPLGYLRIVRNRTSAPAGRLFDRNLRQRPPPSSPVA